MADTAGDIVELTPEFAADPYALYALLRTRRPVTKVRVAGGPPAWLVTRHDDVRAGLTDRRLSKDLVAVLKNLRAAGGPNVTEAITDFDIHDHMLNSDPPKHTRLRKLVTKAFTTRAVARLRPRVEAVATELVESVANRLANGEPSVDLIDALAFPLPMTVICEILGVPENRRSAFRQLSHAMLSPSSPSKFLTASAEMASYLAELVADKRVRPGDDMLSAIVAPDENGDCLSDAEATGMASLLLVAGHETTMNLIGNGTLALLKNRLQWEQLKQEPELLTGAVEEFLRIDSPVNTATVRFATEPMIIGGKTIPRGATVLLAIGSANRDPTVFERPDEVDLQRPQGKSLAFGHGIHYCLGAALARLEGEVAFRILADRLPTLALAVEPGELTWQSNLLIRGLTSLPVRI